MRDAPGTDAQAIADVCWETEFTPCDNSINRYDPNPPAGIPYNPTCYDNRVSSATVVNGSQLHPVRCYSPSTAYGYANCDGGSMTFADAKAFCESFTGNAAKHYTVGVTDWRLPNTPLEAGLMCGSGCGYDTVSVWVEGFGTFPRDPRLQPLRRLLGLPRRRTVSQVWSK